MRPPPAVAAPGPAGTSERLVLVVEPALPTCAPSAIPGQKASRGMLRIDRFRNPISRHAPRGRRVSPRRSPLARGAEQSRTRRRRSPRGRGSQDGRGVGDARPFPSGREAARAALQPQLNIEHPAAASEERTPVRASSRSKRANPCHEKPRSSLAASAIDRRVGDRDRVVRQVKSPDAVPVGTIPAEAWGTSPGPSAGTGGWERRLGAEPASPPVDPRVAVTGRTGCRGQYSELREPESGRNSTASPSRNNRRPSTRPPAAAKRGTLPGTRTRPGLKGGTNAPCRGGNSQE